MLYKNYKKLTEEEIKQNAKKNNLVPVVVKGTTIIRLSAMDKNKGDVDRFEGIDWKRFFEILNQNKLMVVEYKGYMKIVKESQE